MAKKKAKIKLENIALKPQVIGYTYKKKSNIGRVIFIFICFALVVYYINDISLFINNLIGKSTAESIENNTIEKDKNNNNKNPNNEGDSTNLTYYILSDDLSINESGLILNNFKYNEGLFTFDANNFSNSLINLSNQNFFIELYTQDKTLIQRRKVDFNSINSNSKVSFSFDINTQSLIYYVTLVEKDIEDYPQTSFVEDSEGMINFTCVKDIESINYIFKNNKLVNIKHTITNSNINAATYSNSYMVYQNKVTNYSSYNGVVATFNDSLNGFTAVISVDMEVASVENLNEKYYFSYNETPRVVEFEMQTYGFNCK